MGEPVEYPFVKGLDGFPTIIEVKKLESRNASIRRRLAFGHDLPAKSPPGLHALSRQVPPYGGDTLFASQYAPMRPCRTP